MKKYIHIKKEDREFISKALNIGGKSIYNALHFDSARGGTDMAKKVRKLALERGGIVMVEAPEDEIINASVLNCCIKLYERAKDYRKLMGEKYL